MLGVSTDSLSKATQVVDSDDKELIKEMDETDNVNRAYQKFRALQPKPVIAFPKGKYRTIVVDPPWRIEKILRDERPKQAAMDYPMLEIGEIKRLPIRDLAFGSGCHIYLWTTHKHLPTAFEVFNEWGVNYQCLMTWVKNVGFTPFSWMYSTEHILFGRIGKLPLLKNGVRLDFQAKVREHSRKPNEFYEVVKQVSPEPRIDMFSREKRDGFKQWGNELKKFNNGVSR